jgi:hypothetical protein
MQSVPITTKVVSSHPVHATLSVVFSGYLGFLHQYNWQPQYNWNIVESGITHHKTNLNLTIEIKFDRLIDV